MVRESSGVPGAHAPETRAASPRATIIGPSHRVVDANRSVVETGDPGITVDVQASAEARGLAEIHQMILRRTGALTGEFSEAGAALTAPVAGMAEAASVSRVAHGRGEGVCRDRGGPGGAGSSGGRGGGPRGTHSRRGG